MVRLSSLVAALLLLVPLHLHAQGVITIEIGNVQLARSLAAKVQDSTGFPMTGVLVEELSSDWKRSLRTTKTDATGAFALTPVKGRELYYLQLTCDGFNPLRVRVKVDRDHGKELKFQMEVSA